ncbi:MAG: Rha family transcriptional regulator [Xenococcaceae cyanobacterium MO_167.B27]|nr:Rha family transcriptional regulator [Xenococcaceae cyanobacterium MO_167.B27]
MSNLTIYERDSVLVVDSRLIADSLSIKHKNFLATIEKYQIKIESSFGAIAFETREFKTKQGNRSVEKYAWLNEEQSTFLMTLSRNTERVVQCKLELVKAFTKAKKLIKEGITKQNPRNNTKSILPSAKERLETIKLGMDLFSQLGGWDERTQVQLKDQIRNILLTDKLQPSLTEAPTTQPRLEYPVSDRAIELGYRPRNSQLQQIGKQASRLYQQRHGTKPIQREQFVGGTTRM